MILENKFNLKTFTHSDTADRLKIDNTVMTDEQLQNGIKLHELLVHVANRLSIRFAKPIPMQINSGFRSVELNKAVKGVPTSQHCKFQAADTVAIGVPLDKYFDLLKELAKDKVLTFGQVIKEYGSHPDTERDDWIHISTPTDRIVNQFMIKEQGKPYQHIEL